MESLGNGELSFERIISKVHESVLILNKKINELFNINHFSIKENNLLLKHAEILYSQIENLTSNMTILPFHISLIQYCVSNNLFNESQIEFIKNIFGDKFNEFISNDIDFDLLRCFLRILKSGEIKEFETPAISAN